MTTDVQVQFFSHLNGLNLGNNWGDLIRLLDVTLVNGVSLPVITAASIDEQGDVHLSFYTDHKALLFQVVELAGFAPELLNQKYRIKGVPSATSLILKPETALSETVISSSGNAKLASLGYEIIFRDANDVKRVYRAQNPTAQHPFIRVDETTGSLEGSYTETYAKYAMVGLLENMTHIDDYANPDVLQLPFDPSDPSKNWKITGTGTGVVRGWSRWYYAMRSGGWNTSSDSTAPQNGNRTFTLCGDCDAFYLLNQTSLMNDSKFLNGCGLFYSALKSEVIPNWFLMAFERTGIASSEPNRPSVKTGSPLMRYDQGVSDVFLTTKYTESLKINNHSYATPILHSAFSGYNNAFPSSNLPALEVPFIDAELFLRGTLPTVLYSGKRLILEATTPIASDSSMYIGDRAACGNLDNGMFYFYLGELE